MKKFVVYKIHPTDLKRVLEDVRDEELIKLFRFSECTQAQRSSAGFSKTPFGNYVDVTKQGDVVLRYTTQTKTINKHEVAAKVKEKLEEELKKLEMTLDDFYQLEQEIPKRYKEINTVINENAAFEVLKTTYPNEEKHQSVVLRKDGYVFVEGNWTAAEKVLSAIRSAIGSLPIASVSYDGTVADMLKKMMSKTENDTYEGKITLGEKSILESQEQGKFTIANESIYDEKVRNLVLVEGCKFLGAQLNYDGVVSALIRENMVFEAVTFDAELALDDDGTEMDGAGSFLVQMDEVYKFHKEVRDNLVETKVGEDSEEDEDGDE